MNYSDAIAYVNDGKRAARAGWTGDVRIALKRLKPDVEPAVFKLSGKDADERYEAWMPSADDVAATDWGVS